MVRCAKTCVSRHDRSLQKYSCRGLRYVRWLRKFCLLWQPTNCIVCEFPDGVNKVSALMDGLNTKSKSNGLQIWYGVRAQNHATPGSVNVLPGVDRFRLVWRVESVRRVIELFVEPLLFNVTMYWRWRAGTYAGVGCDVRWVAGSTPHWLHHLGEAKRILSGAGIIIHTQIYCVSD